ncbi:unnamed protein product [Hydatigera taeniaeformis]|uniref:PTPRF interacting protein alpha 3 n=1 Tax=Hydatigena taeniaeformis TaxID=6205 RepID=A0A0R3X5U7_HYDTA|nr:unnamed protein product [Hydatigera taeniaeformis]
MCDIMPTIAEDGNSSQGDRDSQVSAEGNTVEDMLLSILDERDRLMENFQEAQEQLSYSQNRLSELEREKDCLSRQLREKVPEVCGFLNPIVGYLFALCYQLLEREDEIQELKAERSNTRLLLEHLECLVARHERSLRMTVVKRQMSSPGGVSSEVEVLKALKSLFEHHKAMDTRLRERLRAALERAAQLEEDVRASASDRASLREQLAAALANIAASTGVILSTAASTLSIAFCLSFPHTKVTRLQRDLRESEAQREDQESRISTLEQRYLAAQHDATAAHEKANPDPSAAVSVPSTIEISELQESNIRAMRAELTQADDRLREVQAAMAETQAELQRARQRERLNEDHSARLTATVDKLLLESNERLQTHLREKMAVMEEKNQLTAELDRVRRQMESIQSERDRLVNELDRLRRQASLAESLDLPNLNRWQGGFILLMTVAESQPYSYPFHQHGGISCHTVGFAP